ncbi:MAG: 4-hydroxy-tetrahydrodipicolinate synthase [Candidatus Aureabacteria bacterium]|nr:4-hydroxy-tetrahydrodipicolinate synthase [Candidatus Auribacterota bacterium]
MFKGSFVAIVTPFKNGRLDEESLRKLVQMHITNGTSGIVPCGTTGESATLSPEEHKRVIEIVISETAKKIPVIAGTGSNNTKEAIEYTRHAYDAGADAALVITPYYNKPTQEGLYYHYKTIANEVPVPIVIYNVPGRTGVSIEPETVARLSELSNIVAIKEASGQMDQISKIMSLCGITVLSGDDSMTMPIMAIGGRGVISVIANIVPADMKELTSAMEEGDIESARELHYKLFDLCKVMFIETNPIPIKTAMAMKGMIEEEFRLPLVSPTEKSRSLIKRQLEQYGLL